MSKRRRLVKFLFVSGTVGAMAHLLIVFAPRASADDPSADSALSLSDATTLEAPSSADEEGDIMPFHNPFVLYPDGKDAVPYKELSPQEKQQVDRAALWAETGNGHVVHAEYSRLSRARGKKARENQTEQLAGVQGLDEVGVK